jgi:putative membrane protein
MSYVPYMRPIVWFGGLLVVFFVVLVFVEISMLIFRLLFRPWRYREWGYAYSDEALELLKLRYVKGEITSDQYREMRKNLER